MTLAQLFAQLQQLLVEHPETATHTVVITPHGMDGVQELASIQQVNPMSRRVCLEARK